LYFVGRFVIVYLSPEIDEKIELYFISKNINHYFGFLFEKGYKIRSIEYAPKFNGNWTVELESQNCIIYIVQDRGNIEVSFKHSSSTKSTEDYIDLPQMISLVTQGKIHFSGFENYIYWKKKRQFEKLSDVLREYIDQISHYFK
jgi:hypothetical protein